MQPLDTRDPHQASPRRILVADDDGHIREVVRYALNQAGYEVHQAQDGRAAWDLFDEMHSLENKSFDLVVLDILMPGLDGLDVCRLIRQKSRIPLIFLSSRDEELDRILGLELGADDYVTKPFSPRELVARVKAALRRFDDVQEFALLTQESRANEDSNIGHDQSTPPLVHGPLTLDAGRHECHVGKELVILTVSEFSLLNAILQSSGYVLTRQQLVERAYGSEHYLSSRTVDSHVRRIRKKLKNAGHECIETVYGVGYRLMELT